MWTFDQQGSARDETIEQREGGNKLMQYEVMGKYTVDILPNKTILLKCVKKNKEVEKSGLDERLVLVAENCYSDRQRQS